MYFVIERGSSPPSNWNYLSKYFELFSGHSCHCMVHGNNYRLMKMKDMSKIVLILLRLKGGVTEAIADYRYLITHKLRCYQCYCVFNSFVYKELLSYNRTPATATDMANFEHVLKMCTKSLPALNIGASFQRDMERSKLVQNDSIMFLIYYLAWKCGMKRAGTAIIASVSCRIF